MHRGCLCPCNSNSYVYTTVMPHGFEKFQHCSETKILIGLWKPISAINQDSAFVENLSTALKNLKFSV